MLLLRRFLPSAHPKVELPTTFPQFNLLPTELRLKIWRDAIPRRTIAVRFKEDLDAWNWATEPNWWLCDDLKLDRVRPRPRLPSVAYVNREARAEVLKWYDRSPKVDREAARWLVPEQVDREGGDPTLIRKPEIQRLNLDRDVIEWPDPYQRRRPRNYDGDYALFLGACLGLRHVSIEYVGRGHFLFEKMAAAVLDTTQSLQTLTVTVVDRKRKHQYQVRLARRPRNPVALVQNVKKVGAALRRHSAAFLPWFKPPEGGDIDGQNWQNPHPLLKRTLKSMRTPGVSNMPDDTQLGYEFAFFLVLRQSDLDDTQLVKSLSTEMRPPPEQRLGTGAQATSWRFGENIQVDIILWPMMVDDIPSILGSPSRIWFGRPGAPNEDMLIPFHGFCSSGYGLPDSQEHWDSHCVDEHFDWEYHERTP